MTGEGGAGFEWVLLAAGALLTVALVVFFAVVLRKSNKG